MHRIFILALAVAALASTAACKGKKADCAAAGDKFTAMMRVSVEKAKPDVKKLAEANLPALKEEMTRVCKAEQWNQATIDCVVEAKAPADLEACDTGHAHGADKTAPAADDNAPAADDKAPAADDKAPAADDKAPAADDKAAAAAGDNAPTGDPKPDSEKPAAAGSN